MTPPRWLKDGLASLIVLPGTLLFVWAIDPEQLREERNVAVATAATLVLYLLIWLGRTKLRTWGVTNGRQVTLLAIVLAIIAVLMAPTYLRAVGPSEEELRSEVSERVAHRVRYDRRQFDLSSDLFKVLPADVQFLARGHTIDKTAGATLALAGPGVRDRITIKVSAIREDERGRPHARLDLSGSSSGRIVFKDGYVILVLKEGQQTRFSDGTRFEYLIYVEKEAYQQVTLAVARREMLDYPSQTSDLAFIGSDLRLLGIDRHRPRSVLLPTDAPE